MFSYLQDEMAKRANNDIDGLYEDIRSKYIDARANGYRSHRYFLREQEILLSVIDKNPGTVLDLACGSGLMVLPLLDNADTVIGLDYNVYACVAAKQHGLEVIRGNTFLLPLRNNSIDHTCNCQFLNQQSHDEMKLLLSECYRISNSPGKVILIWRNGNSLIHRIAHIIFKIYDRLCKRSSFPVVNHHITEVENYANLLGFETLIKQTIFPLLGWKSSNLHGILSNLIGASYFLVLKKH